MWGTNERKEQRVLRLTELYKIAKSNEEANHGLLNSLKQSKYSFSQ